MLAAATARHEIVALIDVLDMLDVASAAAAGVDLAPAAVGPRPGRVQPGPVPRHESARARPGDQSAHARAAGGELRPRRLRRRGGAAAQRSSGCRSPRGGGCNASSRAARRPACWSATRRSRAAAGGVTVRLSRAGGERLRPRRAEDKQIEAVVQRARARGRGHPRPCAETGGISVRVVTCRLDVEPCALERRRSYACSIDHRDS